MESTQGDSQGPLEPLAQPSQADQRAAVEVRRATLADVDGICRVLAEGWRDTYEGLLPAERVERVIAENYNPERVRGEVEQASGWDGWLVAEDRGEIVGAGGGGMVGATSGEVFVLYVAPSRRGEGIGTRLLQAITDQQLAQGAREQWVTVLKGNKKGLPFFEARGFLPWEQRSARRSAPIDNSPNLRLWRYI